MECCSWYDISLFNLQLLDFGLVHKLGNICRRVYLDRSAHLGWTVLHAVCLQRAATLESFPIFSYDLRASCPWSRSMDVGGCDRTILYEYHSDKITAEIPNVHKKVFSPCS